MKVTPLKQAEMVETLTAALAIVQALPVVRPCAECVNFDAFNGRCNHWDDVVPTEAREAGCEEWDGVPF